MRTSLKTLYFVSGPVEVKVKSSGSPEHNVRNILRARATQLGRSKGLMDDGNYHLPLCTVLLHLLNFILLVLY